MRDKIIIMLMMALAAAAVGHYVGEDVHDNLRLRRRSSRRQTREMIVAAHIYNGYFGIYAGLVA